MAGFPSGPNAVIARSAPLGKLEEGPMKKVLAGVSAALILAGCTAQPQPYYQAQPAPRPARPANVGDSCGDLGWGKLAGAAIGGAAGGLIGSQIGRGTGNGLATAAGAIGGLVLGGFAGGSIDK